MQACCKVEEATIRMTRLTTTASLVCLMALSAAGCAVEVPMKAFRMAPPDETGARENAPKQNLKHIQVR